VLHSQTIHAFNCNHHTTLVCQHQLVVQVPCNAALQAIIELGLLSMTNSYNISLRDSNCPLHLLAVVLHVKTAVITQPA
jgi:hypothetical protein